MASSVKYPVVLVTAKDIVATSLSPANVYRSYSSLYEKSFAELGVRFAKKPRTINFSPTYTVSSPFPSFWKRYE